MPASNLISLDVAIRNIKSNFKKISNEDVFLQNSLGKIDVVYEGIKIGR